MSYTITAPPTKTPEEVSADADRAERAKVIDARVAELKAFEGKTFAKNDGTGMPVLVNKYIGIHIIPSRGRAEYVFNVEVKGHYNANVSATDFLAEHHVIETPVAATEPLPH